MKSQTTALGIDIGGTYIKAALADTSTGNITDDIITVKTPAQMPPDSLVRAVGDIVSALDWSGPIGVGYPGVVKHGVCLSAANISDSWLNQDARQLFSALTKQKVTVLNDADAAGIAEMRFGAGDKEPSDETVTVVLTLGTGIGSAVFCGRTLFPNTEFGHFEVDGHDAESKAAASVRVRDRLSWEDWAERLNRYLAEIEKLLSPDIIILGGGVSENYKHFSDFLTPRAELRVARLGNTAGLIGAALAVSDLV